MATWLDISRNKPILFMVLRCGVGGVALILEQQIKLLMWNSGQLYIAEGTAVAQWLRYCATNQKVAGSIPDGVVEFLLT
jgi:hypothetical protein